MAITRREFVQASLLAGAGLILHPETSKSNPPAESLFGVHPFILHNPDAVFVMKTDVERKTDSADIRSVGFDFGRSVFGLTDIAEEGFPLTHKIVIKPNLTCRQSDRDIYTIERSMGIVTDAFFVEGIIESLKELSIQSNQFYIREVNCERDFDDGGYIGMARRTGINLKGIDIPAMELEPEHVQWLDVPDGIWFKKIPYLWPVNAPETMLLNISKFKAHGMGLTLCSKNLQGTIAMNYQAHCTQYGNSMTGVQPYHISPTANEDILTNYNRHLRQGIPRWDRPGSAGGIWQETWATRCLDNNSTTFAGLHIIEGIYGRDGNFMDGPGSEGLATDYMTNYIIFGRNQFYVDIIGHYLGGHEPGNFGLFHMAMERGMISTINPMDIPLFSWDSSKGPGQTDLSAFARQPLKTYYLQRDYNGQSESKWHLVDEPYDYSVVGINDLIGTNDGFYLKQNFPNPVQNSTSISFSISSSGFVSIIILSNKGDVVDQLVNKQLAFGEHTLLWDSSNYPPGLYFYQMQFNGSCRTQKMIVMH
jgi:Domain of unknown function (DUF362)/Secretion system C-terminal sorting domain